MRHSSSRYLDFAARNRVAVNATVSPVGRRVRLWCVSAVAVLWFAVVVWRLSSLQITHRDTWQEWAIRQHLAEVQLASERGPIYDRRGRLMAVSVPAGSVYVRPGQVRDRDATVAAIASVLGLKKAVVSERLNKKSPFVWIERQVPRAKAQQVADLKLPGVGFVIEARRYYPFNHAASALIGKVGVDGVGLSGLEQRFERTLHGEQVRKTLRRDALGNLIQVSGESLSLSHLPKGSSLSLTIDANLQQILDQELEQGRTRARAKATMGVLMDAMTGEILAMGQSPALNFNVATISGKKDLRNLVVETIFEPGSTIKPLVAAAALEANITSVNEILDCGRGFMTVGKNTIKDVHPNDKLSLFDVVVRSSNIGISRLGFRFGRERLREALWGFGFGGVAALDLPGATGGILRPAKSWALIDEATHSFGHGLAVTPLQVVRAISAIANGGELPKLQVVADNANLVLAHSGHEPSQRILSAEVAQQVKEMMYAVVEDEHGTGKRAAIPGIRVGGKTGTAERVQEGGRGYEKGAYIASFVGFADGEAIGVNRTLSLIIVVDRPNTDSIYGGTLAAPVFQKVMSRSLSALATEARLMPKEPAFSEYQEVRTPSAPSPLVPGIKLST